LCSRRLQGTKAAFLLNRCFRSRPNDRRIQVRKSAILKLR
jgi:hypothetical protein